MTVYSIKNKVPVKENGNLGNIHFYGMSKRWAEEAVSDYAQKGLIKALILRYPGLYGFPRKDGFIYNMTKKMLNNEFITIDTKNLKFWEAINIGDAAEITGKIIAKWDWKKDCEIINCSYGEEIDFIKTVYKIKDFSRSKSPVRIKKPLDYLRFYLDNSKLRSLIDFDYDFDRSLRNFVNTYEGLLKK
jgi:nucleoside-diphosphate-sugar epimerase